VSKPSGVLSFLLIGLITAGASSASEEADSDLAHRALAAELRSAQDTRHPMRYRLHKASPRFSSTKEIFETRDGAVARLIAINDVPLNSVEEQKEEARLNSLLSDPSKQRHRKENEVDDTSRVLKVLRALPAAFLYRDEGPAVGPTGKVEKYSFVPNPDFEARDFETEALTEMNGEIWVDAGQGRVARLEGHLSNDVDFGWGMLGRLNRGGWIVIEQADVGDHQWRIVHFQMSMNGRVFFKTKNFDTTEDETDFVSVPLGLGYAEAIQILRADPSDAARARSSQ
jgi:hypothetical protein